MKSFSTRAEIGANRRLFAQAGDPFRNWRMDQLPGGSGRGLIDEATLATASGAEPGKKSNLRAIFTVAGRTAHKCFVNKDD
jgi:hypothetical protein